jgi:CheY-like chemotaxis protein
MNTNGHGGVLVVDDEPQVAWVLRFTLEREGYRTFTASNGVEALEELQKHHPMLMVLDLMMPEMDGWGVLKEMTKLPLEQRPRVVIVSGLPPFRLHALRCGHPTAVFFGGRYYNHLDHRTSGFVTLEACQKSSSRV